MAEHHVLSDSITTLTLDEKDRLLETVISPNLQNDCEDIYRVMLFGNPKLLERFIEVRQKSESLSSCQIDRLLSKAYEDIKLKNMSMSSEIEFCVVEKLITLRSFTKQKGNKYKSKLEYESVEERIRLVYEEIGNLYKEYSGKNGKNVDEKFIFISTFIAKNIHVLKGQLRSTYDKLPWEEIEFCLICFILTQRRQSVTIIYKLVLDKEILLKHLDNFSKVLNDVRSHLKASDVNGKFPYQLYIDDTLSPRNNATSSYIQNNPSFKDLYTDFELIKNVYTLHTMERYINEALSIILDEREELGKWILRRALQIIGECLKNTLDSPNLSEDIQKIVYQVAPRYLREILIPMRDSLSHYNGTADSIKIKQLKFYKRIQRDLKKVQTEITDVLHYIKCTAVRKFQTRIDQCKDQDQFNILIKGISNYEFKETASSQNKMENFTIIKQGIEEFSNKIKDQTEEEKRLFSDIWDIIKLKERVVENDIHFLGLSVPNGFTNNFEFAGDGNVLVAAMNRMGPQFVMFKSVRKIVPLVKQIYDSFKMRASPREVKDSRSLFSKIFDSAYQQLERIKGIEEFKINLDNKEINPHREAEIITTNVFCEIERRMDGESRQFFQNELAKKIQIHKMKLDVISYLNGTSNTDSDGYIDLINKFGFNKNLRKQLLSFCHTKNQEEIRTDLLVQQIQQKVDDSYGKMLSQVITCENSFSLENRKETFKNFLKLFKNGATFVNILENIVREHSEEDRTHVHELLRILKTLLSENDNLRKIQEYQSDRGLQIALEMLVLDLSEMLINISHIENNRQDLDKYAPVLYGKSLRNYLAHGDPLFEILPSRPSISIYCNAIKFLSEGQNDMSRNEINNEDQGNLNNVSHLREYFEHGLHVISTHSELNVSAKAGNVNNLNESIFHKEELITSVACNIEIKYNVTEKNIHIGIGQDSVNISLKGNNLQHSINVWKENIKAFETLRRIIIRDVIFGYNLVTIHFVALTGDRLVSDMLLKRNTVDGKWYFIQLYMATKQKQDDIKKVLADSECANNEEENNIEAVVKSIKTVCPEVVHALLEYNYDHSEESLTHLDRRILHSWKIVINDLLQKCDIIKILNTLSPLHVASCLGHTDIAEILLQNSANINVQCFNGFMPLHFAVAFGRSDILHLLLKGQAKIDIQQEHAFPPLHLAVVTGQIDIVLILLKNGAGVDFQDVHGHTALHIAALIGVDDIVNCLLDEGANVNARNKRELTPLHIAVAMGLSDIVVTLLKRNAYVNAISNQLTPLHKAALIGDNNIVNILIEYFANVNAVSIQNCTPLHCAILNGQKQVVATLLNHNANINAVACSGMTLLHIAAIFDRIEIAEILLKKNVNINIRDEENYTPLHIAAEKGYLEFSRFLLENGADVNPFGVENNTPLHIAAKNGNKLVAAALLENGANVDAITRSHETPLHLATASGYSDLVLLLLNYNSDVNAVEINNLIPLHIAATHGHKKVANTLIKRGAKINAECSKKYIPLHYAAQHGFKELTDILLNNGANIEAIDHRNFTPLHLAVECGFKDIVSTLLFNNANINAMSVVKLTPLHLAAMKGKKKVLDTLLQNKADLNAIDVLGRTALHYASINRHLSIVELLVHNNANPNIRDYNGRVPLTLHLEQSTNAVNQGTLEGIVTSLFNVTDQSELPNLFEAVRSGSYFATEYLIKKGVDILARDNHGTILHHAVMSNNKNLITLILNGIQELFQDEQLFSQYVNALDYEGSTPLMWASIHGKPEALKLLFEYRVDTEIKNCIGMTAFHMAVVNGHLNVVKLWLNNEANINAETNDNDTPIHLAIQHGHLDIVEILVENDADCFACNNHGTILHQAVASRNLQMLKLIIKIITEKVKGNVEEINQHINARDNYGATPLMWACEVGNTDFVSMLLEHGSDIHADSTTGMTALQFAVRYNHLNVVQILIENGGDCIVRNSHDTVLHQAVISNNEHIVELILSKFNENAEDLTLNINSPDTEGDTPLMWAAEKGLLNVARILLKNGAKIDAENNEGVTATDWATEKGNTDIVELLYNYNSNFTTKEKNQRLRSGNS